MPATRARRGKTPPIERSRRCITDRRGVTSIEYAMIGGLIAAVIAASVFSLGAHVTLLYHAAVF